MELIFAIFANFDFARNFPPAKIISTHCEWNFAKFSYREFFLHAKGDRDKVSRRAEDFGGAMLSQHLGHDVRKSNILEKKVLLGRVEGRSSRGRPRKIAKYKIGYLNSKLQLTCQLVSVFYHSFCENNLGLIIIFSL